MKTIKLLFRVTWGYGMILSKSDILMVVNLSLTSESGVKKNNKKVILEIAGTEHFCSYSLHCKCPFTWKIRNSLSSGSDGDTCFPFLYCSQYSLSHKLCLNTCMFWWGIHLLTQVEFQKVAEVFWVPLSREQIRNKFNFWRNLQENRNVSVPPSLPSNLFNKIEERGWAHLPPPLLLFILCCDDKLQVLSCLGFSSPFPIEQENS